MTAGPEPFRIAVPGAVLDDLSERLARTRWPDRPDGAGWEQGTDMGFLRELVSYWLEGFDWRAQESRLNALPQFRAAVGDGADLHFLHRRGAGPEPLPIVLLHGWPATYLQMADLMDLLADPAAAGGDPRDAFHVVVPSLPGFGFSSRPTHPGMGAARMADLVHALMTGTLGYERYAVRGSDFGGGVLEHLAARYPEAVVGTHDAGPTPAFTDVPDDLTDEERRYVAAVARWRDEEGGYAHVQRTRPQSLAYGLADSPAGLAAWIVEKLRRWSDCDGDVTRRFSMDALLTTITIYWVTETIGSSMRLYRETAAEAPLPRATPVPSAFLVSSKDMVPAPRSWAERTRRVDRWTEVDRGGHFLEAEEPQLVADDLRAFLRPLRRGAAPATVRPSARRGGRPGGPG